MEEPGFGGVRDDASTAREAALDGIYGARTSVPAAALASDEAVRAYKRLAQVQRAFRSLQSVALKVRPIHHRLENRVPPHVFLSIPPYYVDAHIRPPLAPTFLDADSPPPPPHR